MEFTLNRNHVLSSTLGFSVAFTKGKPTYVPPELHREAIGIGASPVEGEVDMEDTKPPSVDQPVDPIKRQEEVFAAFDLMVQRNERGDFTAGGKPSGKAVNAILGWEIGNKERDDMWLAYQTTKA